MLWMSALNNALHFIDGLDDLQPRVAAYRGTPRSEAWRSCLISEPFLAWMGFSLAGAIAVFLLFNSIRELFLGRPASRSSARCSRCFRFRVRKGRGPLCSCSAFRSSTPSMCSSAACSRDSHRIAAGPRHFHHRLLDVGLSHQQPSFSSTMTRYFGTLAFMRAGAARSRALSARGLARNLVMVLAQSKLKGEDSTLVSTERSRSLS